MADRNKKEATPPPLLLMPAGGGLTLNPPERPNVLMPVIQSEPSLLDPDLEGEADSFVGQGNSSGPPFPSTAPFAFSQSGAPPTAADPFAQVGKESLTRSHPGEEPSLGAGAGAGEGLFSMSGAGRSSTGVVPPYSAPGAGAPPSSSRPPTGGTASANIYRQKGPMRRAQPPAGTYAQGDPQAPPSGPPSGPYPSYTPPPSNAPFQPPPGMQPPPPTAKVSPMSMGGMPPPPGAQQPPMGPPLAQPFGGPAPPMGAAPVVGGMPGVRVGSPGVKLEPVMAHWCYCQRVEGREIWHPMSMLDNLRLEEAIKEGVDVVATDGGRFDVTVSKRERCPVYWEDVTTEVRRCTWFYKRERDSRYVPYDEEFAEELEREYVKAVTNNDWHKRLTFQGGETIVIHSADVILHFVASSQPDEWGTVQALEPLKGDQMRPRVVKRGVEGLESFDEGEGAHVDHLVFVVHGIGEMCDVKFRSIVECVDDFRSISRNMLHSHFKQYVDSHQVNRVEFLPVHWHRPLHGDATGVDRLLKSITLPSIGKLRHFINDTLMDILFYTSPKYCQLIADTVGQEMNRLYRMYKARNPLFAGRVSVAGHSLGSSVLLDLLLHQKQPGFGNPTSVPFPMAPPAGQPAATPEPEALAEAEGEEEEAEAELSLEDLLARVGLQDKLAVFTSEQIDMDSLIMCSEQDLKDLGLPMGPRKKLRGFLHEEQEKKKQKQAAAERKKKEAAAKQELEAQRQRAEESRSQATELLGQTQSSISVDYICGPAGTGQPSVRYPQLEFEPETFFALGSPMAIFLAVRGTEAVTEDFHLPTCSRVFNIFHPFDPVAYRVEPLINPSAAPAKPVLIPHHKGRKRLHLELKEGLSRLGVDLKQKFMESLKSTWSTITEFAMAHRSGSSSQTTLEQEVDKQMDTVLQQFSQHQQDGEDTTETGSISSQQDDDIPLGQLNEGRRIDYVLQESPVESFNDYIFALASHGCYWESEDTVLMVLRELYAPQSIRPTMPGLESASKHAGTPSPQRPFMPPSHASPLGSSSAPMPPYSQPGPPRPYAHPGPPPMGGHVAPPPPMGQAQGSMGPPPPVAGSLGPPPMQGFVPGAKR